MEDFTLKATTLLLLLFTVVGFGAPVPKEIKPDFEARIVRNDKAKDVNKPDSFVLEIKNNTKTDHYINGMKGFKSSIEVMENGEAIEGQITRKTIVNAFSSSQWTGVKRIGSGETIRVEIVHFPIPFSTPGRHWISTVFSCEGLELKAELEFDISKDDAKKFRKPRPQKDDFRPGPGAIDEELDLLPQVKR